MYSFLLIILIILVIIGIFLILREFFCWYWKINILIKLQEDQIELLKTIAGIKPTNNAGESSFVKSSDNVSTTPPKEEIKIESEYLKNLENK